MVGKDLQDLIKETIADKIKNEDINRYLKVDSSNDTIKVEMQIGFLFSIRDLQLRLAFKKIQTDDEN
jgi:hypothetical protein